MTDMRLIRLCCLFLALIVTSAQAQAPGDSVLVDANTNLREGASTFSPNKHRLKSRVLGTVIEAESGSEPEWYKIRVVDESGRQRTGWIQDRHIFGRGTEVQNYFRAQAREDSIQARQDSIRARRDSVTQAQAEQRRREKREYKENLREQGFDLMLLGHRFTTNSADGVSVLLAVENVSKERAIKYVEAEWRFYNAVGDPAVGRIRGSATRSPVLVGPIRPQEDVRVEWDAILYSSVVDCIELRKVTVTYMDNSEFVYINDLEAINRYADIPLRGDCAYENRQ